MKTLQTLNFYTLANCRKAKVFMLMKYVERRKDNILGKSHVPSAFWYSEVTAIHLVFTVQTNTTPSYITCHFHKP